MNKEREHKIAEMLAMLRLKDYSVLFNIALSLLHTILIGGGKKVAIIDDSLSNDPRCKVLDTEYFTNINN